MYHAYATQEGNLYEKKDGVNIRHATSKDLRDWTTEREALPQLGAWATRGKTWAPYVFATGDLIVMHYSAQHNDGRMCIGAAVATTPDGPFVAKDDPVVCDAIDPYMFVEDGERHVLWSRTYSPHNCGLFIQNLSADGLTVTGEQRMLIKNDQDWEKDINEAPTLIKKGNKYILFYSADTIWGDTYKTGFAVADHLNGPYVKSRSPLMTTDTFKGAIKAPGGEDVITGFDGKDYIVFHGWNEKHDARILYVHHLDWTCNDEPVVGNSV